MVVVKKYGNRRLYDTERSGYVNLDEIAAMVRSGQDVQVVDAASGADLTREVLLQIVLEVLHGAEMMPTGFLRRLVRASGDDPAQVMLRQQVARGLEVLSAQMDQIEALFRIAPFPGAPGRPRATEAPAPAPGEPEPEPVDEPDDEASEDAELAALRERLAALESRLRQGPPAPSAPQQAPASTKKPRRAR